MTPIPMPLIALVAVAFFVPCAGAQEAAAAPLHEDNQIVAKINSDIITRRDVERQIWDTWKAIESDPLRSYEQKRQEYEFHFRTKLQEMMSERVAVQIGREAGITVSEKVIEERVRQRAEEVEGLPRLVQVLGEQGMDLDDLRTAIEEDAVVREVLLTQVGLRPGEGIKQPPIDSYIRPSEMWAYYQKHQAEFRTEAAARVSMIFVSRRKHKDAEARARTAHSRAVARGDFAALAQEYSDHEATRKDGGRLGGGEWRKPGEMPQKSLEGPVWGLPTGGLTDVIDTQAGFFILRVDEKQEARTPTFDEVQPRIRARLQELRLREGFSRVQRRQLDDAYIWPESLLRRSEE